jgi:DNA-binding beta-propeller fold protein YncE
MRTGLDGRSYKPIGNIELNEDADSMAYDPSTKYMYVVNRGKEAHMPYSLLSVIDTTVARKLADIKINSDIVEAVALEKSGPRLFTNMYGQGAVGVIDRENPRALFAPKRQFWCLN